MTVLSGIHNDQPALDLISGGFVSIGGSQIGDPRRFEGDRERLRDAVAATYPEAKKKKAGGYYGVERKFLFHLKRRLRDS